MDHRDHVNLLRKGVEGAGHLWADFGSGTGAFTLALAELLGAEGEVHSVDKDGRALRRQREVVNATFPSVTVHYHHADFTRSLDLPPLDGIVMANALHFFEHKGPVLARVREFLRPGGHFVLVEYDTDRGNRWVPYALSYATWERLAGEHGFESTALLGRQPSRFLGGFYAALSINHSEHALRE